MCFAIVKTYMENETGFFRTVTQRPPPIYKCAFRINAKRQADYKFVHIHHLRGVYRTEVQFINTQTFLLKFTFVVKFIRTVHDLLTHLFA